MPTNQEQRNLIARMKLIPVQALIDQKKLLLIDDSIVRGTQLRETTEFLYQSGAKEVHVRPACPPLLYGCKFLNFSRSKSELDLITRRIILEKEGENAEKHWRNMQIRRATATNPCARKSAAVRTLPASGITASMIW